MAGRGQRGRRAAAGTVDGVQIDIMRHLVGGMIVEMHLDQIALAHADEFAGNLAAESPEGIADAIGQPAFDFLDFEMDDHLGRVFPRDGRRNRGRVGQDGVFLADDFFGGVFLAAARTSPAWPTWPRPCTSIAPFVRIFMLSPPIFFAAVCGRT